MSKIKCSILFFFLGICVVIGVIFLINIFNNSKTSKSFKTSISPDKLHEITYNHSQRKSTMLNTETGKKTYTIISDEDVDPIFIWSPNSQYYAEIYKTSNNTMHNIIYDVKNGIGMWYDTKALVAELSKTIEITDDDINQYVTMSKFLDNQHLLIEFSYDPDSGQPILGWYIYSFLDRVVQDVHITK